jgi:hypothetical protein
VISLLKHFNLFCMKVLIVSFGVQSEKLRRIEESKLSRKKEINVERNGLLPRLEVTNEEHPLSSGKSSLWNQYFQVLLHLIIGFFCYTYHLMLCRRKLELILLGLENQW